MGNEKRENRIVQVAIKFDNDLESRNLDRLPSYFSDDCQIELLGTTLKGKAGVRKWLEWLFENMQEIRLVIINVIVKDNVLFEEYALNAITADGSKIQSRHAEVLEFDDCNKIQKLKLYFDRIDLACSLLESSLQPQANQ
jgi:ketosteroid isomerase-like protein